MNLVEWLDEGYNVGFVTNLASPIKVPVNNDTIFPIHNYRKMQKIAFSDNDLAAFSNTFYCPCSVSGIQTEFHVDCGFLETGSGGKT